MAASNGPVARAGRLGRADSAGASGAGWSSALHSGPLGPLERRVGDLGHTAAFGVAGPGRASRRGQGGRNRAGRAAGPRGTGVAGASVSTFGDSDKRNFIGQSTPWLDGRSRVTDYRSMRPFSTLVT